jgi:hypothetical protein
MVVAIRKYRGAHGEFVALDAADWVPATIDLRGDGFDNDAIAAVTRFHDVHFLNVNPAVTNSVVLGNQAKAATYLGFSGSDSVMHTEMQNRDAAYSSIVS